MSDEFIRCPECGNLNIPGTEKCVFCGAELPKIEGLTEKVETYQCPNCKTELPITATKCPICGWSKEAEEEAESVTPPEPSVPQPGVPSPGGPPVPTVPTPKDEEAEAPSVEVSMPEVPEISEKIAGRALEETEVKKCSKFVTGLLIVFLAIVQYGLNFLIGWVSISILDPNIQLYPTISPNLSQIVSINELAILLHFLFGILIGYVIFNIVKSRIRTNRQILWFWGIVLIILLINIGITALIISVFMPRNILFTYIVFSTAIYLITYIITLFTPNIIGAFLLYESIHKLLIDKKLKQAQNRKATV